MMPWWLLLYDSVDWELNMIPLMMQKGYSPKGWRESEYRALCFGCAAVVMSLTCDNNDRSGSDF